MDYYKQYIYHIDERLDRLMHTIHLLGIETSFAVSGNVHLLADDIKEPWYHIEEEKL